MILSEIVFATKIMHLFMHHLAGGSAVKKKIF